LVQFDEFGPEKILEVYNPKIGMHGFVCLDNLSLGPAKGGIRMTPSVSVEEVSRLARAMTWKNSLAGLPFGGGKSGIIADDRQLTKEKKKSMVEAFAKAIQEVSPSLYIAAPDMNMAEEEMSWISKINGKKSVTGKPKRLGGLPHELGSTGLGVAQSAIIAATFSSLDIKKATIAIEGFGNVGWFAAKFLVEAGGKIVAVSDSKGCAYKKEGLSFNK
jgi:glutamate dehydrogenase (NAD(P)+)